MAFLRAALSSLSASPFEPGPLAWDSSSPLQSGQRFANPGLLGLSSNSSPQMLQVLMGNAMKKYYRIRAAILFVVNSDLHTY